MESQTRSSKWAFRELQSWRVQGDPLPTLRQPFANLEVFFQPLSTLLFLWAGIIRLETRIHGLLVFLEMLGSPNLFEITKRSGGRRVPTKGLFKENAPFIFLV